MCGLYIYSVPLIYLPLCQYHSVLTTTAVLKSDSVEPSIVLFQDCLNYYRFFTFPLENFNQLVISHQKDFNLIETLTGTLNL